MIEKIGKPALSPTGVQPHFSNCVKAQGFVFLSGQLPFAENGSIFGETIEAQTRQCLDNINKILADIGLSKDNIVKATVWLTSPEDFPGFNLAYQNFFDITPPARSTICSTLMVPGAKIEIEAIAAQI
jgi:2-iminobutanoate/2-iminopropanoate deaminase